MAHPGSGLAWNAAAAASAESRRKASAAPALLGRRAPLIVSLAPEPLVELLPMKEETSPGAFLVEGDLLSVDELADPFRAAAEIGGGAFHVEPGRCRRGCNPEADG